MESTHCALVVAIEFPLPESGMPERPNTYFDRALAQPLANQLAFELAKHLPSLDGLGLVWMAACYDQAQILRPELPVHAALAGLYLAGTRENQAAQVMTLQALRSEAPVPALKVDERLLGGAMVLLPFAIVGARDRVAQARTILEEKLLDAGLADARTAWMLNQALGANAEHARLMTLDDLAALCAVQLEHAGLSPVWDILETAIFRPGVGAQSQVGNVQLVLAQNVLQATFYGPQFGRQSPADFEAYCDQVLLARQASAVFSAHGLTPVEHMTAHGKLEIASSFWIDWLGDAPVSAICMRSDARLGVVFYDVYDANNTLIGRVFPRNATAHKDVLARFADQAPKLSA
jgi:hypothetical protein